MAGDRSEMLQQLRQVPQALKDRPQWLMWRLVQKAGAAKPAKLPYYRNGHLRGWPKGKPADGQATDAQPNVEQGHELDRAALVTFDEALDALRSTRWAGIGFAFLPGDGLIGIDIDGAIDPETGEVSERCRQILAACSSYTEASPLGKGLHVYVEGHTETFKSDDIGVEVYCSAQFFTVTGRRWEDYPATVEPIQPQALQLLRTLVEEAREAAAAARAAGAAAKPAGRPQAAPRAVDDFRRVNTMALLSLDAWVPSLFPQARRWRDGWRVSSKALGRTLQEDLQLVPEGIMDFGEEQGYSPIDLVIRWGGASTPKDALQWLASRIGIALQPPKARRPKPTAPEEHPPELEAHGSASPPSAGSAEEEEGDEGPPLDVAEAEAAAQADAPSGGPALDATGLGGGKPPRKPKGGGGGGGRRDNVRALLLKTSDGGIKACRENVALCLEHHPALKGLVGFDQFSHQVRKLKPPPWRSEPGEWTPNDDYELGMFLAASPGFTVASESAIVAGVAIAANRNAFHPVRDWFDSLPAWDEVERLPFWLSECVGAVESDYTRLVGPWFVMGMVQRVLVPGSQMDYMIVLEGPQGQRKSTALRTLVPRVEWFADTPIRVGDKDALLSLAGKMLTEIGELDSFNRAEVTAVKQYVSSRVDRVREPFARRHVDRPRSGVFAGSTNQHEYFKDPTGARRFWPVATGAIDIDKLTEWRDQLYAEALHRLRSDDPQKRRYYPTREETETYLVPQQEAREIGDPWFERIATWVDSKDLWRNTGAPVRQVRCFTSHDILTAALGVPQDRIDGARNMATRVGICMHKLGWAKHRDAAGARLWRYWRPGTTPKDGDGTDGVED